MARWLGSARVISARVIWFSMLVFGLPQFLPALAGGAVGVIGGMGAAQIVTVLLGFPSTIAIWSIFAGLLVATSVGIFFGVYPARKAAELDPIVALRADN